MPGTRETWINTPCGIIITTKKVDICQLVRDQVPGMDQRMIKKSGAVCNCLPKLLALIDSDTFSAVSNGGDTSAAVSALIAELAKLQKVP